MRSTTTGRVVLAAPTLPQAGGVEHDLVVRSMQVFAEKVAPLFR